MRLKQLQLVELAESRALLVVVTTDGGVQQRVVDFPVAMSQEQLTRLAGRLNADFGGKTAGEFAASERVPAARPRRSPR